MNIDDFSQMRKILEDQKNSRNNNQNEKSRNQVNDNITKNYENQIRDQEQKIADLQKQINKIYESKNKKKQKINERDQKILQLHTENQELQEKINEQQNQINQLKSLLEKKGISETEILELNVELMEQSVNTLILKNLSKYDNIDLSDKYIRSKITLDKIRNIQINLEQFIQNVTNILGNPASLCSNFPSTSEQFNSAQTQKQKIIIKEVFNAEEYFKNRNSIQQSEYSLIRFSDTQ